MKTYIIHYSKGVGREELEKLLPGAHFITQYDREDMFCSWLKFVTKSKVCMSYISCNIKHLEALKNMVDNNIPEAFIFEDDVVLIEDWETTFIEIKNKYFETREYIKMGCLYEFNIGNEPLIVYNNGGTEGQYVTLKFATEFLKCVNIDNTIDLMHHGFLDDKGIPCIPVCSQTSIISRSDITNHQTEELMEWKKYVADYKTLPRFDYFEALEKYEKFKIHKKYVEELFYKKYNKYIDIKNINYIYRNELTESFR